MDLKKSYNHFPRGALSGSAGVWGAGAIAPSHPVLTVVFIFFAGSQTIVGVGLRQGCSLSPILFVIFMFKSLGVLFTSGSNLTYVRELWPK